MNIESFQHMHPELVLDDFQKKAFEQVDRADTSIIVAAPTGSGKTLIAEYVIDKCLHEQKSAIYTAPIKALSNQKYRDFRKRYGDEKVGIITGDVRINPGAAILIMTTEIYRNILLENTDRLRNVQWIIFDEIHYMDDFERGTVWEEALMLTPASMHILALSATIPNIDKIVSWLKDVHKRPMVIIQEAHRPVPLNYQFQYHNMLYPTFKSLKNVLTLRSREIRHNRLLPLISHLQQEGLLPAIYFSFSRRRCEYLTKEVQHMNFLTPPQAQQAEEMFTGLVEKFNLQQDWATGVLKSLVRRGIAFHHAGLMPSLKEIIERMFTIRLIQLIFTTETFALGINMPARSVIFDTVSKLYGGFERVMKVRDFQQMAGRAGRRNIDKEGSVFLRIPSYPIPANAIEQLLYGRLEEVNSQFNNSYATLMNLYRLYQEKIYDFYELSFHYYQYAHTRKDDAKSSIRRKMQLLRNLGYLENQALSTKGEFASALYGYELIFAELYEEGVLEQLSPEELCVAISAILHEPRKKDRRPILSRRYKRLKKDLMHTLVTIHRQEKILRIYPRTKPPFFHNAEILQRWYQGESFWDIIRHTETDEGELVRHFRMCIQILREMRSLPVSPAFKETISTVLKNINRDIIDAEKQLTEEL